MRLVSDQTQKKHPKSNTGASIQPNDGKSLSKLQEENLALKQTIKELKQNENSQSENSKLKQALEKAKEEFDPVFKKFALKVLEMSRKLNASQKKVKSSSSSFDLFWKENRPVTLQEQDYLLSGKTY